MDIKGCLHLDVFKQSPLETEFVFNGMIIH
jgi:hypothetical protein